MSSNLKTYALKVHSNFENKAVENIKQTILKNELNDYFGEIINPQKEETSIVKGKAKIKKIKLLPSYLLIEMSSDVTEEMIRKIVQTNRVQGFLGINSYTPSPLTQEEIDKFLNIKNKNEIGSSSFNIEDNVRILEGPFQGFEGTVEAINGSKIKVNVLIFGRPTPVELSPNEITKLE